MALVNNGEVIGKQNKDLILETAGRLYVKVHDREPEFVAKARYYDISKLKYRKEHLYAVNKYMENK